MPEEMSCRFNICHGMRIIITHNVISPSFLFLPFAWQINTSNILFICGGAFAGMEEVTFRRLAAIAMSKQSPETTEEEAREVRAHVAPSASAVLNDNDIFGLYAICM